MKKENKSSMFLESFTEDNLKDIFETYIQYSGSRGIDNLNATSFKKKLEEHIRIIRYKIIDKGDYKFSKYKLKLLCKGRGKAPREISIPTVRDKIVLKVLCNILQDTFTEKTGFDLPQNIVKEIKEDLNKFDSFIRLDITNFYPSINHEKLISILKEELKEDKLIHLIKSALTSPTVSISRKNDEQSKIGIPQGLSISNILAAIYLYKIDKKYNEKREIRYFRYVDDVIILCSEKDIDNYRREIISNLKEMDLEVHSMGQSDKSQQGSIKTGFSYLGYKFEDNIISVRNTSIEKLKNSLASIFTKYKYSKNKSKDFLIWILNLRITGCILENKCKGWLFFFSQINDEKLLHILDNYVMKLCKRYKITTKPKRFVKAFKEISLNKYNTKYIPNFDLFTIDDKRATLKEYFSMENINTLPDQEVEFIFLKKIKHQIKDLETDLKDFYHY